MLDKQDVTVLREMLNEALITNNEVLRKDLKKEMREEMHSLISASEHRLIQRMDTMEKRITTDIADLLDTSVLPQIAELQMKLA